MLLLDSVCPRGCRVTTSWWEAPLSLTWLLPESPNWPQSVLSTAVTGSLFTCSHPRSPVGGLGTLKVEAKGLALSSLQGPLALALLSLCDLMSSLLLPSYYLCTHQAGSHLHWLYWLSLHLHDPPPRGTLRSSPSQTCSDPTNPEGQLDCPVEDCSLYPSLPISLPLVLMEITTSQHLP
jgi:hypothetical protein